MKPLVIIPARGGSKGIPKKNIKPLGEKPLIQYTVDAARNVFNDSEILVSTDDINIKTFVESLGLNVPFLRPKELASDVAGTHGVLLHGIEFVESKGYFPDLLVLLQPTSPFRTEQHITEALALYGEQKEFDMVVSVTETKANPYYVLFEENDMGFLSASKKGKFERRQDCPKVWQYNGAIYIVDIASLKLKPFNEFERIKKYEMNEIASHDLDTPLDWVVAEKMLDHFKL